MSKVSEYEAELRANADWEPYLLRHSGLPGPRGNLELAHAVAHAGTEEQFLRWSALGPEQVAENTPEVFLAFCGTMGLGALLARYADREGQPAATAANSRILQILRTLASDPRWRVREAVATGLQLWGDADFAGLLAEMRSWAGGGYLEQRAAAAALCEPRLLGNGDDAAAVIEVLDDITRGVAAAPAGERKNEAFRTLRQALGYCWSVGVAANPAAGLPALERWLESDDIDVRWIMRENLRKKRIAAIIAASNIQIPE